MFRTGYRPRERAGRRSGAPHWRRGPPRSRPVGQRQRGEPADRGDRDDGWWLLARARTVRATRAAGGCGAARRPLGDPVNSTPLTMPDARKRVRAGTWPVRGPSTVRWYGRRAPKLLSHADTKVDSHPTILLITLGKACCFMSHKYRSAYRSWNGAAIGFSRVRNARTRYGPGSRRPEWRRPIGEAAAPESRSPPWHRTGSARRTGLRATTAPARWPCYRHRRGRTYGMRRRGAPASARISVTALGPALTAHGFRPPPNRCLATPTSRCCVRSRSRGQDAIGEPRGCWPAVTERPSPREQPLMPSYART